MMEFACSFFISPLLHYYYTGETTNSKVQMGFPLNLLMNNRWPTFRFTLDNQLTFSNILPFPFLPLENNR